MTSLVHLRRILQPTLAAVLFLVPASASMVAAQPASMHRAGQAATRQPMAAPHQAAPKQNQEHLAQWMDRHSNLPLADQQKALENEPGFRDLPPQTQQRMRDRLTQLNNMTPDQRQRILAARRTWNISLRRRGNRFAALWNSTAAFPRIVGASSLAPFAISVRCPNRSARL